MIFGATPEGLDRLVFEAWQNAGVEGQARPTMPAQILLERPGERIGRYRLLSVLGGGGMGMVYLAEQERPVTRRVALKVIKPGMDSKRVLARFEAEQQALALMEHPYVARVHDAGTTPSGRPYFVMEYVKGLPITAYCDAHRLTIEDRLRLFLQVCEAVQHAHQKGIIHRDIKPSNILVTVENDQAAPKVIDFGVARAMGTPLTEQTLHTEQGQLIGTPEYMSPEQADRSNEDIDTRTDVYALGVVLYELIAGVLPLDPDTLREHGLDGARKVICEQDPQTPSTKLSRTSIALSEAAAEHRGTTPRQLQRRLRGDLDWITLRALEKDRSRRYASVGELAADVLRHLNHEPVAAGRPSPAYRARKFVRRHRALVAGLAAVLAVLVAGVIASSVFAVKAKRSAEETAAVADFLQNVVYRAMDASQRGGRLVDIKEILDEASQGVSDTFGDSPLHEASIQKTLGALYANAGCFEEGQRYLRKALEIFTRDLGRDDLRTVEVLDGLGHLYWGWWRYREAEHYLTEALGARMRLQGPDHPETLRTRRWLGWTYYALGYAKKAQESLADTCDRTERILAKNNWETTQCMVFYACALLQHGHAKAERILVSALEQAHTTLGPRHPLVAYPSALLGRLYSHQGHYAKAHELLAEALTISREAWGENNGGTFHSVAALAENYARQGQVAEAERLLCEAIDKGGRAEEPQSEVAVRNLPYLGFFYLWQRRFDQAKDAVGQALRASLDIYGEEHPITFLNRMAMGMACRKCGRYKDAEEHFDRAIGFARDYLTSESLMTSGVLHERAVMYHQQGRYAEAEQLHLEVLGLQRALLAENHWHTLGTLKDLIALYTAWAKTEEARQRFTELQAAYARQASGLEYHSSVPGSMRYDATADIYVLVASASPPWTVEEELNFSLPEPSSDMWHVCDDLQFAGKTLYGDGAITARIDRIIPSHYSIEVGVMIRSTLDPAAPQASVVVTPLGDVLFQYRTTELGAATSIYHAQSSGESECWIRLTRAGDRFIPECSLDGIHWQRLLPTSDPNHASFVEIPMDGTVHIGLIIASSYPSGTTEARISHVTVTGEVEPIGEFESLGRIGIDLNEKP